MVQFFPISRLLSLEPEITSLQEIAKQFVESGGGKALERLVRRELQDVELEDLLDKMGLSDAIREVVEGSPAGVV